ncbi:MAG: PA14 domain-containing protein [Thermoplasmatota archaeon]
MSISMLLMIIAVQSLLLVSTVKADDGPTDELPSNVPSRGISLSGEVDIYDAIDTQITGKTFDGAGHRIGTYSFIGDINGDGYNDIALTSMEDYSAQGVRGDGRIYIFFGNESGIPDAIDLDEKEADQIIMGDAYRDDNATVPVKGWSCIGNQMEIGDLNNDGYVDIILSVPRAVTCVRESVIIWGEEGGLPKEIVVNLTYGYEADYNFTILTAGQYSKEMIPMYTDLVLTPKGSFGMERDITNDFMLTEDIDRDGYDDLISAGFLTDSYGKMPRVWTLSIYWGSTGNKTVLFEEQGQSFMSESFDLGDIDGDGEFDLVVGAPYMSKKWQESENYGAAMVLFNISKYRFGDYIVDEQFIPMNESYDAIIWGSGEKDWFGNKIRLYDIDDNGRDEIFIGAPYADGPADLNQNSGQIYMFKGRPQNGFPKVLDADNGADSIVYGDQGYQPGPPEVMADSLGNKFEIADIDANGELEFIAGLPLKNLPEKDGRQRSKAGIVMVYELKDLFNDEVRIVQISNSKGIFVLHGYDIEDNLGYQLLLEDVDTDGIKDIFLTAPMADGPDNTRPRCGEAYVIRGKGLVIKELGVTGPAVTGRNVFLGDGELGLNLPYTYTNGSNRISQGKIIIDPGNMDLQIDITRDGVLINQNLQDSLLFEDVDLKWTGSGEKGNVNITLKLDWDLITNEWLNVHTELISEDNETITRMFPRALILRNDVHISNQPKTYHDTIEVLKPGRWFTPGEELGVDRPVLRYKHDSSRAVTSAPLTFELLRNTTEVLDTLEHDGEGGLSTVIEKTPMYNLSLRASAEYDQGQDWVYGFPDTGDPFEFRIPVDNERPLPPEDLSIHSRSGVENFSSTGHFDLEWSDIIGMKGDPGDSGIKSYGLEYKDSSVFPKRSGGLLGTYYQDFEFIDAVFDRVDSSIDFLEWGLWSPDPSVIPPDHFSVRWHGYIELEEDHPQYVRLSGKGQVKIFLNDSLVLDWFDLRGTPRIGPYEVTGPTLLPIEIYYRHGTGRSGIKMEYLDSSGSYEVMEEDRLHVPSNRTVIEEDINGLLNVSVFTFDWTGKRSAAVDIEGFIDNVGPQISFQDMRSWYGGTDITIKVKLDDGDPLHSSGTDAGSIEYRMKRDGGDWSEWMEKDLWFLDEEGNNHGDPFRMVIDPELDEEWKGVVQVRADDRLGNPSISDKVWFGVDTDAPSMDLLDPVPGSNITANQVRLTISTGDIGGSGVDESKVLYRCSMVGEDWSTWEKMTIEQGTPSRESVTAFTYLRGINGEIRYQFKVSDSVGNSMISDEYRITISRVQVNLPPQAVISEPEEGQVFEHGVMIHFSAFGTTDDIYDDPEMLCFTWISSIDGHMGNGFEIDSVLSSGNHTVRLYVYDRTPGNNVSTEVNITVKEKGNGGEGQGEDSGGVNEDRDDDMTLWVILLMFLVAVITITATFLLKRRYDRTDEEEQADLDPIFGNVEDRELKEE